MTGADKGKELFARHYTSTGRFYIGNAEKQQQVCLMTNFGNASALWNEDEAPYDHEMTPTEVSLLIRERLNSYWISTSRADQLKVLDAIDANGDALDRAWYIEQAKKWQEQAAKLHRKIESAQYWFAEDAA